MIGVPRRGAAGAVMWVWFVLAPLWGCGARGEPAPPSEPRPTAAATVMSAAPSEPPPATTTATAAPLSAPSAPPEPPSSVEARFAPVDRKCSKDADCAVTQRGVSERLFCCDGCDSVAGAKAWVKRADELCKAYAAGPEQHACPPRDCIPPGPARCHQGRCELVPTRP